LKITSYQTMHMEKRKKERVKILDFMDKNNNL
jgi:hypothetical protein